MYQFKNIKYIIYILLFFFSLHAYGSKENKKSQSINFKNGMFQNIEPTEAKSLWRFFKMRIGTKYAKWPKWIETKYKEKPQDKIDNDEIYVRVINHASVLIQGAGYNIITDPIYSERCSPVSFAGPKRVRNPSIKFEDLPKIDVIAISHDHYDHLDLPTIKMLVKRDNPKIFVGLGVASRFTNKENIYELDWHDKFEISKDFALHFLPVQHFSGRGLFDRNSTLWGGFMFELGGRKIYFGGDSGYGNHYKQTYEKFGEIDLALLPIGAYAPKSFMGPVHMDPEDAVKAHLDLKAKRSIGIHYGTFQLTAEGIDEPIMRLEKELEKEGIVKEDFVTPEFGDTILLKS